MALDLDVPRLDPADSDPLESLESLTASEKISRSAATEEDEPEIVELPGMDPVLEDLQILVIPPRRDEFVCEGCFMIRHRAQRAAAGTDLCRECAD